VTGTAGVPPSAHSRGAHSGRPRGILFSRPRLLRLYGVLAVAAVLVAGLVVGGGRDTSAEPAVQAFLLDWQQGEYLQAGRLTTGDPKVVADALRTSYQQLNAASVSLSIGPITQHGSTAEAQFGASVDLGQGGAPWTYTGRFALTWTGSAWRVQWNPSVINPALRPGTRLAVRSTLPPRGLVLDSAGQPLQPLSLTYSLGVRPDRLADPQATATAFGRATGLDAGQLTGLIRAAPRDSFLSLLTLSPAGFRRLHRRLAAVPGLVIHRVQRRLFDSVAGDVVGTVGTENSAAIRQVGLPYQPGDTAGESGLQQSYQRRLVGTPTTEVVVEDTAGHLVSVLASWRGHPGLPVRTTLSSAAQIAANQALARMSDAAAIVAVQASTGKVLAVASRPGRGAPAPDPLAGRYPPGQAFTIVSTAALLDTGLSVNDPVPCTAVNDVGGQTFTNDPPALGLGDRPLFSEDFAYGCGTAFAGLSRRLTAGGLARTMAQFGMGSPWRLPLASFAGAMPAPADLAQLAADTIGGGGVQVSPLALAMIAAQVDSGRWHAPSIVTSPPDPPTAAKAALSDQLLAMLRSLMRTSVRSGAARQADLAPGLPIYGQPGQAPIGHGLRASWFAGYRGDVAFAVLRLGHFRQVSAVPLAAAFLRLLPASLLDS
jgi:cell division protein FtsI/penicillin-binding protein 2